MSDIIRLLPDSVANQIAAGEVIQRPASAVKELLENAIDSGATEIRLIIKDAGKTLIQVIDNGCGMSETDARRCFERHATSKIHQAEDLFAIRTMGFRGEAMASIAAIAQVEMKTRRVEDELGTEILIEGTRVKSQNPCACPSGTSISVKNLFFNTPARRNFLKSETTELNYIIEEFFRVALVNQHVALSLSHNNKDLYNLSKSTLKQRIVQLFGSSFNEKLVDIGQTTDLVGLSGFIGKPEHARKTRGEQYFFVNGRFIKHPFFNHAVDNSYKELIQENHFPTYFIYFEIDPAKIDVNIHPTKTEVKFLDDRIIYAILQSAVKQGLGKFSLTPAIDFDVEQSLNFVRKPGMPLPTQPEIKINPDYNPFKTDQKRPSDPLQSFRTRSNQENWEKLYPDNLSQPAVENESSVKLFDESQSEHKPIQFKNRYILTTVRSGMMLIDQQRAHERIIFEQYLERAENQKNFSQQELFPHEIRLSEKDALLLTELLPDINQLGFSVNVSRQNNQHFVITGIPVGCENEDPNHLLDEILENYKTLNTSENPDKKSSLALSMAKSLAIKPGKPLKEEEMNNMIDSLFATNLPEQTPDGQVIINIITLEEIINRFK